MKFSIKGFFSKCHQIHGKLRIWSHLLKKSLMGNFSLCAVYVVLLYLFICIHCFSLHKSSKTFDTIGGTLAPEIFDLKLM